MTDYVWDTVPSNEVAQAFAPLSIDWWIAGGVAIDLFAGRKTREHGDIDVAILRRDVLALKPLRSTWDIHIAHSGQLNRWDGAPLQPAMHQFWARRLEADAWSFEILLEQTERDDWIYRRDQRIRRPVGEIGARTPDGVPYLAPEVCLLYKSPGRANEVNDRNAADFETALPLLDRPARSWLASAIRTLEPSHPWIARLNAD